MSSISNGWLFWFVNHTSIASNSELKDFRKIWFVREIPNKLPKGLFETNVYKTLKSCWWWLLTLLKWTNKTSVILRCSTFAPFLSLVILFSVCPSNLIVSYFKSSRLYQFLILNLILFFVLFTYIFTDGLSTFSPCLF